MEERLKLNMHDITQTLSNLKACGKDTYNACIWAFSRHITGRVSTGCVELLNVLTCVEFMTKSQNSYFTKINDQVDNCDKYSGKLSLKQTKE